MRITYYCLPDCLCSRITSARAASFSERSDTYNVCNNEFKCHGSSSSICDLPHDLLWSAKGFRDIGGGCFLKITSIN